MHPITLAGATLSRAASLFLLTLALSASAQDIVLPSYHAAYPPVPASGQWQSARVIYVDGRLTYPADAERNRIPDFSYSGYRYGEAPLPAVPEVQRLSATTGDQTARIQAALDAIGARTPDARGLRGALVLNAGTYDIAGTIRVNKSGVVLRGVGDGSTGGTVLRITGDTPHQRNGVVLGSGSSTWTESTTRTNIITSNVQVGSLQFDVESAASFAVGDTVLVRHPSTQAWIDAVDQGGVTTNDPWRPGTRDIVYYRRIVGLSGTRVTLDAPIYNHLNRALSQSYMAKVSSTHITESGVENLRIDIVTAGGEDENHAWNALAITGAQDCWVRSCTMLHFGYGGIRTDGVVRITVEDVAAIEPVGIRTGGRFYNLVVNGRSQLVLFTKCHVANGRHGLVSNGQSSVSGVVFHRCTSAGGADIEGGHRDWSQAMLFDNIVESGSGTVKLINRGDWGSSHGWGCAHSVSWRFNKASQVQKPPTAQNYGVTDIGTFSTSYRFKGATGSTELQTGKLIPESLYEAQHSERLARKSVRIVARHSGKTILVQGASTADGAAIVQGVPATGTHDEWQITGLGTGFCSIRAVHSGKAMNVKGISTAEGAQVHHWTWGNTATNDEWKLEPTSGGYYRLTNRHSGKVLAVASASTADGALLQQQTWTGANHQQFGFRRP